MGPRAHLALRPARATALGEWQASRAGLITSVDAAGELIEQIVRDAERVIRDRAELITVQSSTSP